MGREIRLRILKNMDRVGTLAVSLKKKKRKKRNKIRLEREREVFCRC